MEKVYNEEPCSFPYKGFSTISLVIHIRNDSTWETEAGNPKLKASLGCIMHSKLATHSEMFVTVSSWGYCSVIEALCMVSSEDNCILKTLPPSHVLLNEVSILKVLRETSMSSTGSGPQCREVKNGVLTPCSPQLWTVGVYSTPGRTELLVTQISTILGNSHSK